MELCQKSLLRDWTHVQEAILLTARFMEACTSKNNGIFSAVISERFGTLQGENRFLLGLEKVTKGGRRGFAGGRGVLSRDSPHEETTLLISI